MKVRFSIDMIRCRLTRDEVSRLADGHPIFLSLPIAPTSVTVVLEPTHEATPSADSRGGVRVRLPESWLAGWPESEEVGFDFDVDASSGVLRIVVEKDFPCAHDASAPPRPKRMS